MLDILIAASHFRHEATSHTPEIISPLADDLSTRCNNNDPIDLIPLNEFLRGIETFMVDSALGDVDDTIVVVCFEVLLNGASETRA